MRLLVLSDLHLEAWRDFAPKFDTRASRPDVVVLAGDIHTKARAPAWAARTFSDTPVMYVSGNHEFYGEALDHMGNAIRVECEKYSNVHYLDCDEYVLQGVRFLGVTLWTDFLLFGSNLRRNVMDNTGNLMNDYHRIRVASAGYRKLRPQDTAQLHAEQRSWLEAKLSDSFLGPTVVITHMAPSRRSVAPQYASDLVSGAFASDLDEVVRLATLWIHGHTHTSFDYSVDQCRVVANPLGYMMRGGHAENDDFDPSFIVELS
ncbi:metallophosphoesterase [Massilia sp. CMS3.1]|uniref:metallophosphoesterase n=1 Tax=Massilia sp. CMS3.1 TaxID=3373083 RepID=UPI003EE756DF